jgi:maleylacetoacetate isomerase
MTIRPEIIVKLYSYHRSSASYRVRIALNMKGIDYDLVPVNLKEEEQYSKEFKVINPQGFVPVLEDGENRITQSLAILEYLEEKYPSPSLLPGSVEERAKVRALAQQIAVDLHPLNNLRVLKYLVDDMQLDDAQKNAWYHHWVDQEFQTYEAHIEKNVAKDGFCAGQTITFADICLIPQVYNALRFNVDMNKFPSICCVYNRCMGVDSFISAAPENQPDAPEGLKPLRIVAR